MQSFETDVKLKLFDDTFCRYQQLRLTKMTLCYPFYPSRPQFLYIRRFRAILAIRDTEPAGCPALLLVCLLGWSVRLLDVFSFDSWRSHCNQCPPPSPRPRLPNPTPPHAFHVLFHDLQNYFDNLTAYEPMTIASHDACHEKP